MLTENQENAVKFMKKKSKIIERQIKDLLFAKFCEMGYTHEDYVKTIEFVGNSDPVIHFKAANLIKHLEEDTHYRNMFEVRASGGSTSTSYRSDKEGKIFYKFYNKSEPSERVKYGAINIFHSPLGVRSAHMYGDSYMILDDDVRNRISFLFGNSSNTHMHICTYAAFQQILYYIPENCLRYIIDRAIGKNGKEPNMAYVECQIHGPLLLSRDIKYIVLNDKHKTDKALHDRYQKFCDDNNCGLKYMGDM